VSTGFQSKQLIVENSLRLGDVDQFPTIDVTIDGADEWALAFPICTSPLILALQG